MRRVILYTGLIIVLAACEEIYIPKLDNVENAMVVEARIVRGESENIIKFKSTLNFNTYATNRYPDIDGASVTLIDNENNGHNLPEIETGNFKVDFDLNPELQYKLRIEYNNDIFESEFESVPEFPQIDSIYANVEEKVIDAGGTNSVNDFWKRDVLQFYIDINETPEINNYRFTWRKIAQYIYIEPAVGMLPEVPHYAWFSSFPGDIFNIALPPEYKTKNSIEKHPIFFIGLKEAMPTPDELSSFNQGYIFVLYQYALSESAAMYYKDLNNQLGSEGHIFDPMYVQARNNLRCVNNPDKLILGNFEVTAMKERRYFVQYLSEEAGFVLKEIPYFYDIPGNGDVKDYPPDFWESKSKTYP
jgi:hypothetical protein